MTLQKLYIKFFSGSKEYNLHGTYATGDNIPLLNEDLDVNEQLTRAQNIRKISIAEIITYTLSEQTTDFVTSKNYVILKNYM